MKNKKRLLALIIISVFLIVSVIIYLFYLDKAGEVYGLVLLLVVVIFLFRTTTSKRFRKHANQFIDDVTTIESPLPQPSLPPLKVRFVEYLNTSDIRSVATAHTALEAFRKKEGLPFVNDKIVGRFVTASDKEGANEENYALIFFGKIEDEKCTIPQNKETNQWTT